MVIKILVLIIILAAAYALAIVRAGGVRNWAKQWKENVKANGWKILLQILALVGIFSLISFLMNKG